MEIGRAVWIGYGAKDFCFFKKRVRKCTYILLSGFRKWRFTLSRFKKKTDALLAQRVVPTVDREVCIALGNWSE